MKRRIAAIASCLVSFASLANEVRYFTEDQVPTVAEVASLLAPPAAHAPVAGDAGASHGGRTRIVRVLDTKLTPHRVAGPAPAAPVIVAPGGASAQPVRQAAASTAASVASVASVGSLALALRYGADATHVQAQHRTLLDALAEGIKLLPETAIVTVAGHTDAFGSPAYNIDLSLKRAMAVRAYLMQTHGIAGKRIVALGKGKSEPLNRANPYAPENRRVQVHAEYEMTIGGAVLLSQSGS